MRFSGLIALFVFVGAGVVVGQQLPTLPASNGTTQVIFRDLLVQALERSPNQVSPGGFTISGAVSTSPRALPSGAMKITINLSDTKPLGLVYANQILQITEVGSGQPFGSPTAYIVAICKMENKPSNGLGYLWMLVSDNSRGQATEAKDIVSFVITDLEGDVLAYGSGPVVKGDAIVKHGQ